MYLEVPCDNEIQSSISMFKVLIIYLGVCSLPILGTTRSGPSSQRTLWLVIGEAVGTHFDLSLITGVTSNRASNEVFNFYLPLDLGILSVKADPDVFRLLEPLLLCAVNGGGLGNALISGIEARRNLKSTVLGYAKWDDILECSQDACWDS